MDWIHGNLYVIVKAVPRSKWSGNIPDTQKRKRDVAKIHWRVFKTSRYGHVGKSELNFSINHVQSKCTLSKLVSTKECYIPQYKSGQLGKSTTTPYADRNILVKKAQNKGKHIHNFVRKNIFRKRITPNNISCTVLQPLIYRNLKNFLSMFFEKDPIS